MDDKTGWKKIQIMQKEHDSSMDGHRYCSSCLQRKHIAGGAYKITQNGKTRRWKCVDCHQRGLENGKSN